ncbi:unnamed protein product [Paramecium pentaurelia]|uniref:Uncharacterized protein n=1 Tax=Paramecium pentaurelia TaxID=43138 RepID=A0A8S1SSW7_9CILI|nr:unnamed protein product [Paramecium pentaurelia]
MTKICILTKGQLLGEEIVINEDGCCEYNSIVLSNEATVMVIHKHEFFQKFPEECKQWVKEEYYKKSQFRKIFQSKSMESVFGIGKPKFITVKQFIDRKNYPIKINSKQYEDRVEIGSLIEKKTSVYLQKYQIEPQKDSTATLFGYNLYQTPKLGYIPQYDKCNNIPLKAFKEQYLKKLCYKKRRLEFLRPPPLTARILLNLQTNQCEQLNKIQHTHTHTQSTAVNSFTPCLSSSPNYVNKLDIN